MNRRHIRVSQIIGIAVSLTCALFGAWYRAFVDKDGFLAQGGFTGLVAYLLFQLFLNAENELAIEMLNVRVDDAESAIRRCQGACNEPGVDSRP